MGMFDWVRFKCKCPKCGTIVDGFQSKDRSCGLNMLDYWEVDNFYASCKKCEQWIEFNRIIHRNKIPLTYYKCNCVEDIDKIHTIQDTTEDYNIQ